MCRIVIVLCAALLAACPAQPPDGAALARDYLALRSARQAPADLKRAAAIQADFVARLVPVLGEPVGYKAGLTSAAAQRHFGIDRPLRGTLLRGMLVPFGSSLPWRYGARPMAEADLLVRVAGDGINEAQTDLELLAALDAVMPFIELVDLVYHEDVPLGAAALLAANVGARYGVIGNAIVPTANREWLDRLGGFTVQLRDGNGRVLGEGSGSGLLGHPINVVRWLRDSLHSEGLRLKRGDLLSLGSLTALVPVTGSGGLHAVYTGLQDDGPVESRVTLR